MGKKNILLRPVREDDAKELAAIYRPYVTDTAITFEYEAPDASEFVRRIRAVTKKYPWICAVDETDRILGYMYSGAFKSRPAYDWGVETSIYLAEDARGRHIGTLLESAYCRLLKAAGYTNVNACITFSPRETDAYVTPASPLFHEHLGYKRCAHFHECGYKFGQWYDMIWMEKIIAPHEASPRHPGVLSEDEIVRLLNQ
ncbi:MAG: GNAT family N-acetyltransferase [Lachnospiraceae bacterium]|jgi:phosphinothricin acetyltransferase|nr:GNAT family N-acetyltransferase [Lachnospiraceae bacterium]MCH4108081.1 GNAT family N-acetyltransferase [Lachnospiraceae bacterium]MCI1331948.1 GNAT family N-acetyltransferase [Lachnospiraceae bacterium]MCI1360644.1 GNAT family N-acetyltransferase [Lachnospiraceae bacterium]MCI1380523.1 GNAT family N-acetyltransferase [Lachnospiraceae bacterium]